jgi:DNA-binding XRE family transcriptional regulator
MPKRDSVLAKLGLNVRKRREARELTQENLAERASLDATYISGIERGLRNPGIKNVAKGRFGRLCPTGAFLGKKSFQCHSTRCGNLLET